ncbi:MAG TPA: HAD family hydrolase [Clostridia bacterium]|nr:HAD family hydrolase [Clostridia bacterium]
MKYNTVIFDMDGTILDTLEDLHGSVNYALKRMGFPERSLAEIRSFLGDGIVMTVKRSVPKDSDEEMIKKCVELFRAHYANNMNNKTKPYEGILDLITRLRQKGIKTAVVSNKSEYAVVELCEKMFFGLFDVIVGQTEDRKPKPEPDGVIYAIERLGVGKDEVIFVGDSDVDVLTAQNAGLSCVGVTWGFRDREVLERMKADFIIDAPFELLEIAFG